MKRIAVTAESPEGLDSPVAGHFGGAPYFAVVTVDDGGALASVRSETNPHAEQHQPGAVPRFVRQLGADVVIAGGMGQRAQQVFAAVGIEVRATDLGSVREAVEAYLRGELHEVASCHVHDDGHDHGHDHHDHPRGHGRRSGDGA